MSIQPIELEGSDAVVWAGPTPRFDIEMDELAVQQVENKFKAKGFTCLSVTLVEKVYDGRGTSNKHVGAMFDGKYGCRENRRVLSYKYKATIIKD